MTRWKVTTKVINDSELVVWDLVGGSHKHHKTFVTSHHISRIYDSFLVVECDFIMTLTTFWWLCVSKYRLLHSYGIHGQCLLSSFRHHTHGTQQTYLLTIHWRFSDVFWKICKFDRKLYAKKKWQNFEILRKLQIYGNWTIYVTLS